MNELLVEYAAGTLGAADRTRVEEHLAGCAGCRADLAGWVSLAQAARTPAAPPGPELVRGVLMRSALAEPESLNRRRAWFSLSLVLAEACMMRVSVLLASALVMALGVAMSFGHAAAGGPGDSYGAREVGTVRFIDRDLNLIQLEDGTELHTTDPRMLQNIQEGMQVEFDVRKQPDDRAGAASNVRLRTSDVEAAVE